MCHVYCQERRDKLHQHDKKFKERNLENHQIQEETIDKEDLTELQLGGTVTRTDWHQDVSGFSECVGGYPAVCM